MLAAAQSPPPPPRPPPPPPPPQRSGPAHRHLALLRTADWRQSAATPLPHATGESRKQGAPLTRGCVRECFPHIQTFLQSRPTRRLQGFLEEVENQTGAPAHYCILFPLHLLSHLSSFSASALFFFFFSNKTPGFFSHPEYPQ